MRSGHKSNAVCTVIMKHFNAQYLTIALSFVTILYTALVSWTDIVQGLRLYSHFVDHSLLNSVHDITTCMNVHASLQKLMGYFNQSMVSSVAASLSCLQVQSTYCVCICHQRHIGFVLWTIVL